MSGNLSLFITARADMGVTRYESGEKGKRNDRRKSRQTAI